MNMAFTAGCFFILQCIFLMDVSVADPLIDVSPSEINIGITPKLDINCTFSLNTHPDMAAFISLVLSRANSTGQDFEDLAAITEFSPDSVKLLTQEKVSATGFHSDTEESFLQLTWQNPTLLQGGVYKCSALGVDMIGHNLEITNISSVTLHQADINDVFYKLQQLEMHESSMRQQILTLENDKLSMEQNIQSLQNDKLSIEQRFQNLENYIHTVEMDKLSMEQRIVNLENYTRSLENDKISMEKQIADLEHNNLHLKGLVASLAAQIAHFDLIGSYDNKYYYVSSYAFTDINNATDVCKSLGGTLAVIDDQEEFKAVQGFLTASSGIHDVVIAGSDEKSEGNWVLPDTNTQLPFTSWGSGHPVTDRARNCLWLASGYSWYMMDWLCRIDSPRGDLRFMCEV